MGRVKVALRGRVKVTLRGRGVKVTQTGRVKVALRGPVKVTHHNLFTFLGHLQRTTTACEMQVM